MSVTSIAVNNKGREEGFVSISSPIAFLKGFIKLILQVDSNYYAIYKNLITGEWSTDIKAGDRIGNDYFRNIGLAIDKAVKFSR
jgi:hypothetical protein